MILAIYVLLFIVNRIRLLSAIYVLVITQNKNVSIVSRSRRASEESNCDSLSRQAAIRISHSLPDLQTEPLKQEYVQEHKEPGNKKVSCQDAIISVW